MSNFQWYRKMIGGNWFYCRMLVLQGAVFCWTQNPENHEAIVESEVWS